MADLRGKGGKIEAVDDGLKGTFFLPGTDNRLLHSWRVWRKRKKLETECNLNGERLLCGRQRGKNGIVGRGAEP